MSRIRYAGGRMVRRGKCLQNINCTQYDIKIRIIINQDDNTEI